MKKQFALMLLVILSGAMTHAAVETGKKSPDFSLKGSDGKSYKLSQFKGKTVVLEWLNHECPFVKKHYESGNMQALQREFKKKGVVWLSVISSAPKKQGYSTPKEANENRRKKKADPFAILLDPKGEVGKRYSAKTTPHMFVIDPKGVVAYQGAIDDIRSTDAEDVPRSKNYVRLALNSVLEKKPVEVSTTRPYGCSVKY